jgi:YetA-like protein
MADPRLLDDHDPTSVELIVDAVDDLERRFEPVTCGIPWPRGVLRESSVLVMTDEAGLAVPLQARALDRWADGSVRWALLDWRASVDGRAVYRARIAPEATPEIEGPRVNVVSRLGSVVEVSTGRATFRLGVGGVGLFDSVEVDGVMAIDAARTRLTAEDGSGTALDVRSRRVEVLEAGPIRASVRIEGDCSVAGARPLLRFVLDAHFFAGSATIRLELTLHNPAKAGHPGGLWDLGGAGSVFLKQASLTLALPDGTGDHSTSCSPERGRPDRRLEGAVDLYQDSSGGENWKSTNHVNRDHAVPVSFRGYRLRHGPAEDAGLRATPSVSVRGGDRVLALAMEHFWENFPKAIDAQGGEVSLRIFPAQFADVHEIQGGEQKTHVFHAAFGVDDVAEGLLEWCRSPLLARAKPQWYCSSGAIPYLVPKESDPNQAYVALVDAAIEGPDTFERKREVVDEYGWRHFGDVYGDHEAVFHHGEVPLVSHFNNQYDNVAGFAYQYLRSGDRRWCSHMDQLARHVVDIDIYHTEQDRSAYNGGLFWHTCHYVDADTAAHRTYPRAAGVAGGGPSGGQNYSTGLVLHHFLTGDPRSRSAAIGLARWVIDMDDGRKAPFGWLDGHPHGHATASGSSTYHGPGRAPANSLNVLLNAYRLTQDQEYLDKAEQIIRRCIHPRDDINARNLLDAENKWFYTMFLQALGRYLDDKEEAGATDRMYYYARESLLQYARWMAEREYPYLDKPEILEYPTETWAAQDMRKSDVFKFAAKHAGGQERQAFLERSDFFFRASTTTLAAMPTRTLARPVVLLLGNGYMHAYYQNHPEHASPVPHHHDFDFGAPESFVPQKVRVLRKLKTLAAAGAILALLAAAGWAWVLLRPR